MDAISLDDSIFSDNVGTPLRFGMSSSLELSTEEKFTSITMPDALDYGLDSYEYSLDQSHLPRMRHHNNQPGVSFQSDTFNMDLPL